MKKNNIKYKLTDQQLFELNKEFYENYPCEYFFTKWFEIISKLANTDEYINAISGKEFSYRSIKVNNENISKDIILKNAKIEIHELYIHCLECFFRLFIARAKRRECDWLEMNNLSIKQYHEALEKISKGEFTWLNSKMNEDEIITYSLTGCILKKDDNYQNIIKSMKSWIKHAASELQSIGQYNSYKHGMTLNVNKGGYSLTIGQDDPLKFEKYDDVLVYLVKQNQDGRSLWAKQNVFVNAEYLLSKVYIYANLLNNMINAGKYFYHIDDFQEPFIPNENFTFIDLLKLIKDGGGEDCSYISYTQSLSYYKYTDKK